MKWNHSVPCEITIEAPWPTSVNKYWRAFQNRMYVTQKGKEYKAHMRKHLLLQLDARDLPLFPKPMRLECNIQAFPPDKRGRDVDNIQKVLLDSLTGIIWEDDVQVYKVSAEKIYVEGDKNYCIVTIKEME